MIKILKYLVAVTDHLAAFAILLGIILSFSDSHKHKKIALISVLLGFIAGSVIFGIRLSDPKGTNLMLMAFNRKLIIAISIIAVLSVIYPNVYSISILIIAS
ncbi:MAG: hypothetical protein II960_02310, partial [Synergistaceae bacterium]|nr:hypothetical protein [Synergistaceae bacterium]